MQHRCWSYFVYFFVLICITSDAYKILVFNPRFGKSHVRFMGTIADTLVEAGHNVVGNFSLYFWKDIKVSDDRQNKLSVLFRELAHREEWDCFVFELRDKIFFATVLFSNVRPPFVNLITYKPGGLLSLARTYFPLVNRLTQVAVQCTTKWKLHLEAN